MIRRRIDCGNAYELSEWWKQLLGYVDIDNDPNEPGHQECAIRDPETGHERIRPGPGVHGMLADTLMPEAYTDHVPTMNR